jgi:hypothetical protein
MRLIGLRPLFLLGCLLSIVSATGAQTDFDNSNKQGLRRNPAGLRLVLRTKDGRATFHLFEAIPLKLEFSSSLPSTYSIELDESMNFAGWTHKFEVEPKDAILLSLLEWGYQGVSCCESEHQYVSRQATVFDRELTNYLRFKKAGTYHLFLTTQRVFKGAPSSDFSASKILLTSNILTLTILPDDPDWDAQRLAQTLRKLQDPHVKANYDAVEQAIKKIDSETGKDIARANRLDQTEFAQAQKALNALDTREAIQERVHLMDLMSKEQISWSASPEAAVCYISHFWHPRHALTSSLNPWKHVLKALISAWIMITSIGGQNTLYCATTLNSFALFPTKPSIRRRFIRFWNMKSWQSRPSCSNSNPYPLQRRVWRKTSRR